MQTNNQQGWSLVQTLLIMMVGSIVVLASNEFLSLYFVRASQTLQHWQQRSQAALAASYISSSVTKNTHQCGPAPQFHADVPIASQMAVSLWSRATALSHGLPVSSDGAGQLSGEQLLITQALTPGAWLPWLASGQRQLIMPESVVATAGDALLISDCQHTEVIKIAQVKSTTPQRITLASPVSHEYAYGAKVMPLKTRVWYLGHTDQSDQFALYAMDQRLKRHAILSGLTGLVLQADRTGVSVIIQSGKAQEQLWLGNTGLF